MLLQQRLAEHVPVRAPSPNTLPITSASTTTSARRNNIDQHTMHAAIAVVHGEQDLAAEGQRATTTIPPLLPADGAGRSAVGGAATTGAMHAQAMAAARAGHF